MAVIAAVFRFVATIKRFVAEAKNARNLFIWCRDKSIKGCGETKSTPSR